MVQLAGVRNGFPSASVSLRHFLSNECPFAYSQEHLFRLEIYQSAPYGQIRIIRQFFRFLPFLDRFKTVHVMYSVGDYHPSRLWSDGFG